jgi:hypothetical protein
MGNKPDDPEVVLLQKSVDTARDACRWMETELGAARKIAADCTTASRKAIRERKTSEALEQKQSLADLRVTNLAAELGLAKTDLAELENKLDVAKKNKQCEQDAAEFDKRIATFADKGDVAIKAIAEWAKAMEPLNDLPDMLGTFLFFSNVAAESPATREMHLVLLRQRRDAILAGAATLSRPAPAPAPIPPPAPVIHVCTLKAVAWMADGMVQTVAAGTDIDLPPKIAQHAAKIGACCEMGDPRRRTIKQGTGFKIGKPLRRNCIDLDPDMPPDDEPEPFREPILRSSTPPLFQVVDRGPPKQMMVARNNLDNLATRNNNEDDKK